MARQLAHSFFTPDVAAVGRARLASQSVSDAAGVSVRCCAYLGYVNNKYVGIPSEKILPDILAELCLEQNSADHTNLIFEIDEHLLICFYKFCIMVAWAYCRCCRCAGGAGANVGSWAMLTHAQAYTCYTCS